MKGVEGTKEKRVDEDEEEEVEEEFLPEKDLRCLRNNGRDWQCSNWRIHGKAYCQDHFLKSLKKTHSATALRSMTMVVKKKPNAVMESKGLKRFRDEDEDEEEEEEDSEDEEKKARMRKRKRRLKWKKTMKKEAEKDEQKNGKVEVEASSRKTRLEVRRKSVESKGSKSSSLARTRCSNEPRRSRVGAVSKVHFFYQGF